MKRRETVQTAAPLSFSPLTAVRTRVASKKARAGGATPAPSREGENGAFFAPYRLNEHKASAFKWKSALLCLVEVAWGYYYDNTPNE